jgi:hypothetical protein
MGLSATSALKLHKAAYAASIPSEILTEEFSCEFGLEDREFLPALLTLWHKTWIRFYAHLCSLTKLEHKHLTNFYAHVRLMPNLSINHDKNLHWPYTGTRKINKLA